jgi:membrane-associated phospholipid phosphatase
MKCLAAQIATFLTERWSGERWTGRPLTLTLAAAVTSGWLFGGMLQDVISGDGAAAQDPHWHQFLVLHRIAVVSELARALSSLGLVGYITCFAVVVFVIWRRRFREAILALAVLAVGQLLRLNISILVHRPRPPRVDGLVATRGYAFPSGHAMTSVLICGLVVALAWPWLANRIRRTIAVAAATAIALIDGAARAYLGVHWPLDVLGGWALGSFLVTLAIATMSLLRLGSLPTPTSQTNVRKCVLADGHQSSSGATTSAKSSGRAPAGPQRSAQAHDPPRSATSPPPHRSGDTSNPAGAISRSARHEPGRSSARYPQARNDAHTQEYPPMSDLIAPQRLSLTNFLA